MTKHNKLSTKPRTDLNTDLNGYDLSFLPTPTGGPFICNPGHVDIFGLEFFDDTYLSRIQKKFQNKLIKKIGLNDFMKIELGLKDFVTSSSSNTRNLLLLKKSILKWRPDILTEFLSKVDQEDIQHLKIGSTENISKTDLDSISDNELISHKSLTKYQKEAITLSFSSLKDFGKYCIKENVPGTQSLEDISFYRGFNNRRYFNPSNKGADILSHYSSSTEDEKYVFFERNIFTSYSISSSTAEQFMVAFNTRRRAMAESSILTIVTRIFSSFIVSPSFYKEQFEFLALPSAKPLYIYREYDNGDMANFKIVTKR